MDLVRTDDDLAVSGPEPDTGDGPAPAAVAPAAVAEGRLIVAHGDRTANTPPASADDLLQQLAPHIHEVLAGATHATDRLARTDLTALHPTALQPTALYPTDAGKPFAMLDRKGKLVEVSTGFVAVLRTGRLLATRDRQLVGQHPAHRAQVEDFVQSAVAARRTGHAPLPIRLTGPASPRGIVLRAIPLGAGETGAASPRPAAVILLVDLDSPARARHADLRSLFGLTPREADVAIRIAEGCSAQQAADSIGISLHTVKQHMKSVFGKMMIERQSELASIVARL